MNPLPDTCAVADLPPAVRTLLWSYRLDEGAALPPAVVAAAVMDRGDLDAMRWLLRTFGRMRLAALLPTVSRRLSPRSQALWACLLEQPHRPATSIPWIAA